MFSRSFLQSSGIRPLAPSCGSAGRDPDLAADAQAKASGTIYDPFILFAGWWLEGTYDFE